MNWRSATLLPSSVFLRVHLWFPSILLFGLALLTGCSLSSAPQFRLNTEGRDPASISRTQAEAIAETLRTLFGTPDGPLLPRGSRAGSEAASSGGRPDRRRRRRKPAGAVSPPLRGLPRHLGRWGRSRAGVLNPYPRDFRNGIFKFTSTAGGAKPLRKDLLRTLRQGLPGTAMPSFCKLPDPEIEALLEYVKYLSIRGQTELYLLQTVVDEDAILPLAMHEVLADGVLPAAKSWDEARALAVVPPSPPPVDAPSGWPPPSPGASGCSTARAANA